MIKLAHPHAIKTRLFSWALIALLITLKATGWLLWGWWAVLSPLWAPPLILFVVAPVGLWILATLVRCVFWWV
jgi:hypothetical protein